HRADTRRRPRRGPLFYAPPTPLSSRPPLVPRLGRVVSKRWPHAARAAANAASSPSWGRWFWVRATNASARLKVLTLCAFAVCTISTNAWVRRHPRSVMTTPSAVSRIRAPARRGSCDRPNVSNSHSPPAVISTPITHHITYGENHIFPPTVLGVGLRQRDEQGDAPALRSPRNGHRPSPHHPPGGSPKRSASLRGKPVELPGQFEGRRKRSCLGRRVLPRVSR